MLSYSCRVLIQVRAVLEEELIGWAKDLLVVSLKIQKVESDIVCYVLGM